MLNVIEEANADQVWLKAASMFKTGHIAEIQPSRAGNTHEIMHVIFSIKNPIQRWIVSRKPAINPAFAIAEAIWIINGREDAEFLNFWNRRLPKYAGNTSCYHGAYGHRLRNTNGIDQLDRAFHALRHNPDGRQIVLQIWDSKCDLPLVDGTPVALDIPCNIISMLKIRNGKLEWTQVVRSNDLFLGTPYNFVQFTMLQEIMAGWLQIDVGGYYQLSDSLHVYDEHLTDVTNSEPNTVDKNKDSLAVSKDISERLFKQMSERIEFFTRREINENQLTKQIKQWSAPEAYKNLLRVVAAESARKRNWSKLSEKIMDDCSNPILTQVWSNWLNRFAASKPCLNLKAVDGPFIPSQSNVSEIYPAVNP